MPQDEYFATMQLRFYNGILQQKHIGMMEASKIKWVDVPVFKDTKSKQNKK